MLSRAGLHRGFIRLASTKSDKIPVQLLVDVKPLGASGEVIKVKPAFMRNFLHVDNKACYITEQSGPRIPVVLKKKAVKAKTKMPKKTIETAAKSHIQAEPALSLDDLSALFAGARAGQNKNEAAPSYEATSSGSTYNLMELEDALPQTYTHATKTFPVTKALLSSAVFNATGIEVPSSMIRVKQGSQDLSEISVAGDYSWTFQAVGESTVLKKNLRVQ